MPFPYSTGDQIKASDLNKELSGWNYYNKISFASEATTKSFTSLPLHDEWKIIFSFKTNTNSTNPTFLMTMNGITSNTYRNSVFYDGSSYGSLKTNFGLAVNNSTPASGGAIGEFIMTGKYQTLGNKCIYGNGRHNWSTGYLLFNGFLDGDNADLSSLEFTANEQITGTVELYYRDLR